MERDKPTKPTLLARIQTYAIVSLIAVLIWLYSESENVKQQKPLSFVVRFVAPPGQQLLIVPDKQSDARTPTHQEVVITVRCATSQYAQLERLQAETIELAVTPQADGPQQTVDLRTMLLDSPIGDLGVTIQDVRPPSVPLRVERVEMITMPIKVVVADGVQLATNPTIEPTEADFGLPASLIGRREELTLEARLERDATNQLDPNVPRELIAPVVLSTGDKHLQEMLQQMAIQVTPPSATLTVSIRKQIGVLPLKSLPILITAPWAELQRFSVEIEKGKRVLDQEIKITGPSDIIDSIDKNELRVWADLRLTADDLESGITSKQLHINVPPNVQVESAIPWINFTITPIATTTAPPP